MRNPTGLHPNISLGVFFLLMFTGFPTGPLFAGVSSEFAATVANAELDLGFVLPAAAQADQELAFNEAFEVTPEVTPASDASGPGAEIKAGDTEQQAGEKVDRQIQAAFASAEEAALLSGFTSQGENEGNPIPGAGNGTAAGQFDSTASRAVAREAMNAVFDQIKAPEEMREKIDSLQEHFNIALQPEQPLMDEETRGLDQKSPRLERSMAQTGPLDTFIKLDPSRLDSQEKILPRMDKEILKNAIQLQQIDRSELSQRVIEQINEDSRLGNLHDVIRSEVQPISVASPGDFIGVRPNDGGFNNLGSNKTRSEPPKAAPNDQEL